MTTVTGPVFQFVEEVDAGQRHTIGGFGARTRPLLVKGALNRWPARHNWSFEQMAALRYQDGTQPVIQFQNGLVEQGATYGRSGAGPGNMFLSDRPIPSPACTTTSRTTGFVRFRAARNSSCFPPNRRRTCASAKIMIGAPH